jgi:phage tail-like protein
MTCVTDRPTFRFLDPLVGWDPASCEGLSGCEEGDGLRLAPTAGEPGVDPAELLPYFGHPRLARGCGDCEWYLVTPAPAGRLLRLEACHEGWRPVWPDGHGPHLPDPVAVATRGNLVAVADRATRRVLVWDRGGEVLLAELHVDAEPIAVALAPWGEVLVAVANFGRLRRFGLDGTARSRTRWQLPAPVVAVAFPRAGAGEGEAPGACTVLLVTRDEDGQLVVWLAVRDRDEVRPLPPDRLGVLLGILLQVHGVVAAGDRGFCLVGTEGGLPVRRCFTWWGRPLAEGDIGQQPTRPLAARGQLLTRAIDSGIPRCQWHRVRIDADVPHGTTLEVDVATSEADEHNQAAQGCAALDAGWEAFQPGVPHPGDWQRLPSGVTDALLTRPPGRYLFVRVRLRADGHSSPVVHRVRLDFPRVTSLEHLPAVWRQDPAAEDFTARFLSLFDARVEDLDDAIARYPALLDAGGVPDAVLPWLAGLLGLSFEADWPAARRRALLRAAPELYRLRGTPEGLRRAVQLVFDVVPVIQELGPARAWGALGGSGAALGSVRLFGPSRVRFRLDRSALARTPIRSLGDPERDAHGSGAHRFRVLVPPGAGGRVDPGRLRLLVASQAPAHTVGEVRVGGSGLVVGQQAAVGIDTVLVPLPPPVLGGPGGGTVRLSRRSVLWHGRRGSGPAVRVGDRSAVGVNTIVR